MAMRRLFPWDNPAVVEALDRYPDEISGLQRLAEVLSEVANMPITRQGVAKRLKKMGRTAATRINKENENGKPGNETRKPASNFAPSASGTSLPTPNANSNERVDGEDFIAGNRRLSVHFNRTIIDVTQNDGIKRKFYIKRTLLDGSLRLECVGCKHAKYDERRAAQLANREPVAPADGRVKYVTRTVEGVVIDDGTPHMENCRAISDVEIAVEETKRREVLMAVKEGVRTNDANIRTMKENIPKVSKQFGVQVNDLLDAFPISSKRNNTIYKRKHNELGITKKDIYSIDEIRVPPTGDNWLCATDEERGLVMLATREDLRDLANSDLGIMDGTFTTSAEGFAQMFAIHGKIGQNYGPVVHVLMRHRETPDYVRVFELLKKACEEEGFTFQPKNVITDYERALRNAVRQCFPNTRLLGCLFHYTQAVLRKAYALGFKIDYKENGFIYEWIRNIIALPLLPPEKAKKWWTQYLKNGPQRMKENNSIMHYLKYLVKRNEVKNLQTLGTIDTNFFTIAYNSVYTERRPNETNAACDDRKEYESARAKDWLFGNRRTRNTFLDSELVMVPVHLPGHWCLVVIDNIKHTITYYDSLFSQVNSDRTRLLMDMFMHMSQNQAGVSNVAHYQTLERKDLPQQTDGVHCGVFVLAFATYVASGKDIIARPNQEEIKQWRQLTGYIAYCDQNNFDRMDCVFENENKE